MDKWTDTIVYSHLVGTCSWSKVNRPPGRQKEEVIKESKDFTARLVYREKHGPPIPRQASQSLDHKKRRGTTTTKNEKMNQRKKKAKFP
jgi:hypothetical protein